MKISDITDTAIDAVGSAKAFASGLVRPSVRLGVTGLANAGKTVFITALIHNLMAGGRLPFFDAAAEARITRVYLEPQPDDAVPRFDYERHIADLTDPSPRWPESTRRLSQVRLTIEYESREFLKRQLGRNRLHVDIVDYPGEWLLDLPLVNLSFEEWADATMARSEDKSRKGHAKEFHGLLKTVDPKMPQDEETARRLADLFTSYLRNCRQDADALIASPPGRFLMPGDLEGSPALTFAPIIVPKGETPPSGSLWSMLERRFEAYKAHVVQPFFRDHFARLDRQIVLVDTLAALNTGAEGLAQLEQSLSEILACYRPGANSWLNALLRRRIDRIVFAATKADHLHHTSHDRLEAILARLTESAISRAQFAGAEVNVLALAAVRATREGHVTHGGERLPCILGYPIKGEVLEGEVFDGKTEYAVFPGDLPSDPEKIMHGGPWAKRTAKSMHFVRFRPPILEGANDLRPGVMPNIRLDRAINFLIGDKLA